MKIERKHKKIPLLASAALVVAMGCANRGSKDEQKSITVFCGSASKPAMEEIAGLFEREKKMTVNLIFGGSGTLLSQIELSKQGEIYIPGSPDYISIAKKKKLLIEGSDRIIAYLVPAIITPKGNPKNIRSLADLTKPGVRVGIGNPKTVCLGLYAIELLEKNEMLETVLQNTITFGASCSKTANLAAMNQLDAILGWRVFHFWSPDRMDYVPINEDKIPRISYIPIAIPVHTKDRNLSKMFIDFVLSEKGQAVYEKLGYLADEKKAKTFAPKATIGGEYKLPKPYIDFINNRWKK